MDKLKTILEGIRVIDFGQAALAPVCGRLLADLGADVIKVEPLQGDFARITSEPMVDSVTFIVNNLDKRSLSVNLAEEKGREIIRKLVTRSDALIHNFRPGVMERLGFDYEKLKAINARLVYGSFYMYGESGPLAHKRGGDMWAQAFTGLVASQGSPDGPPQMVGHTIIDYSGGVVAAFGIMAALFARERTGEGQEITSSLINTGTLLQWPAIAHCLMEGVVFKKVGRGAVRTRFPYGAYTAKDGDVVTIFGQDDAEWPVVCSMLGIEHLLNDPRYDTIEKRNERRFELYSVLDQAFKKKTRAEWSEIFKQNKLRCDPCLDYAEFTSHPQFRENKLAVEVDDPRDGNLRLPATPVDFKAFPRKESHKHAPILGEHTREVLLELGYSDTEISDLNNTGIVAIATPDMFKVNRTLKGTEARRRTSRKSFHAEQSKTSKENNGH